MTQEEFTRELLDGLGLPPAYFPQNVMLNIKGYESLDTVIKNSKVGLSAQEFEAVANQGDVVILDVRNENDFVGILIGLIGAGGGFLIIPALIHLAKLPIKKAIGTSLFIITINSLVGFLGDVQNSIIDWSFLLTFTTISVIGIFVGLYIQQYINEKYLKKIFGIFVLVMSVVIFYKEFFHKLF